MKQENRHIEEHSVDPPAGILAGRHAVTEAIKAGRGINRILIADGLHGSGVRELRDLARAHDITVDIVSRAKLDAAAEGARHGGMLAYAAPVSYVPVEEIISSVRARGEEPLLLLLDGIEDPHNLGALLRTADAAGVHGILLPRRHSVPLTETVARVSAGALEYVPVARIGNIAQTIRALKEDGFWIAGADMAGSDTYDKANLTGASVAGAILMYEAMRQRTAKDAVPHG